MKQLPSQAMRQWINNTGQSILELAIFGSILLFVLSLLVQYGLSLNYDQNLKMQTFRKALTLARQRADTSRQIELTVVKDQTIPNPADQFGASETSPYTAQASAAWTEHLNFGYDNQLKPKVDLPHIDYIINGKQKSYTIANYGYMYCTGSTIPCNYVVHVKKKENDLKDEYNIDGTPGSDNIYWYWTEICCDEIELGDSGIDIDKCGKEEMIYEISKVNNDPRNPTSSIYYLKFQDGEIDTTKNKDLGEEPQGLQAEYTKSVIIDNASVEKWENESQIKTTTKPKTKEVIRRKIKTNIGDVDVESTIERESTTTWTTPH